MNAPALGGRGILVTRPAGRAAGLASLIVAAGGEAVLFPALEILSISIEYDRRACHGNGNVFNDIVVFVSPTAVEHGLPVLSLRGGERFAAVGGATARALRSRGISEVLVPQAGADSEALAALPEFQAGALRGRRVLIVRGEGGRDWLRATLVERGARVEFLECYRRVRPVADPAPLVARWRAGGIAAVTMTSREALDNLMAMLPAEGQALARATPLFAAHERIAGHARVLGMQQVRVAGPGDEAMVAGLRSFFATLA